jgi:hydrogenase maturation protease
MVLSAMANLAAMAAEIAIIGCGNPNRRDDGAAAEVLRLLGSVVDQGTGSVRLLDAGTDGMAVMFAARGCRAMFVIDACSSGAEPGAVFELPGAEFDRPPDHGFNLHDFRWDHALHAGRRILGADFPAEVRVFLIEGQSFELGIGLSPPVARATQQVAERIGQRVRIAAGAGAAAR